MRQHPTSKLFRQLSRIYIPVKGMLTVGPSIFPRFEEVEQKKRVIFANGIVFSALIENIRKHRGGVCPRLAIPEVRKPLTSPHKYWVIDI